MCVCVCVCVAKPGAVELRCHVTALIFPFMDSFVFKQHRFFLGLTFSLRDSVTLDYRVQCPRVRQGVKI